MSDSPITQASKDEIERMVALSDLFACAQIQAEDEGCSLTSDNILALAARLKASYDPSASWVISSEAYKAIQRINSQRPHQRKLRKCVMRKIVVRQRRERRHR